MHNLIRYMLTFIVAVVVLYPMLLLAYPGGGATSVITRPALVGDETIIITATDAGTSLVNTGSAGGTLTHSGTAAVGYQQQALWGTCVLNSRGGGNTGCWNVNTLTVAPAATGWSLSAWVIMHASTTSIIAEKPNANGGPPSAQAASLQLTPSGFQAVATVGGVAKIITSTYYPALGQISFAVATWDGTNFKIYVNGVLEATTAASGTLDTYATYWNIGGREGQPYSHAGRFWEIRLNPSVLSAATIAQQWKTGMGLP